MAMSKEGLGSIPEETIRVARAIYPKGNLYMQIRDELEGMLSDELFADLYASRGRPSISPSRLALVLIMQYIAGYSDRQAVEAVRDKISWKYALSLDLEGAGFDPSILTDFRQRLFEQEAQGRLFEIVLKHLSEKNLLKGHKKQRTDATHILAHVRNLNRIELVGESIRSSLNRIARVDPDWLSQILPQDWIDRYSQRFTEWHLPKQASKRQDLVNQIGQDGYDFLSIIYQNDDLDHLRVLKEVEIMRQIWVQQFVCDEADFVKLRDLKDTPQGANLIQSPFDIEARYTHEKPSKKWLGYKTHWTETCDEDAPRIISHVLTGKASDNEVSMTTIIQKDLIEKDLKPDEHYLDAGYSSVRNLLASQDNEIDLFAPIAVNPSWQARNENALDISCFSIDWDTQQVLCPNDMTSTTWSHSHNAVGDEVIHVRFRRKDCQACSLKERCTKAQARSLKLYPRLWHELLTASRQGQTTSEFRDKYRTRAGIEGTFSLATRTNNLRQTPFIGLQKTDFHCLMSALALNIKRAINWINNVPIATTRKSPLQQFASAR